MQRDIVGVRVAMRQSVTEKKRQRDRFKETETQRVRVAAGKDRGAAHDRDREALRHKATRQREQEGQRVQDRYETKVI